MADNILDHLLPHLKSGYGFVPTDRGWHVEDNNGVLARDPVTHQPILVGTTDSPHNRRRALQNLRSAGIARPARRKERKHVTSKITSTSAHPAEKSPLILAKEILRDTRSTSRERAMARAYIVTAEQNEKIRRLAQALGARIKELEEALDST
jgi:hypothetical protein